MLHSGLGLTVLNQEVRFPIMGPVRGVVFADGALFVAELESGKVTLTDEPCTLNAVTNAPKRVTWLEPDGKTVEEWEFSKIAINEPIKDDKFKS